MEPVMAPAKAIDPQERAIQTVRPAPRRATAARGTTAEGREGVRPGRKAMTALSVMNGQAGMTAVAVTTVRTGKAARIGRVSQTVQIVQIALSARTGLIGLISRGAKIAITVRKDRAGRTERTVAALRTTVRAASDLATIVQASLQARVATNPRVYGFGTDVFVCAAPLFLVIKFRGAFTPPCA